MAEVDLQETEKIIQAIQDIAIILTGAIEFVCEGRMLKRFSRSIEENLEKLENNIALLKIKFPEKFPETLKFDSSLSKIRDVAIILKGDNADIEAKCGSGKLGNEVTLRVTELKAITKNILDVFREKKARYTIVDKFASYGGRTKSFLSGLYPLVSNTSRIFLAAILVIIFSFVYLFLIMESEDVFLKSIKNDLSSIENQRDMLAKQRQEYEKIKEKIKSLDQAEMDRQEKIEWLSLSIKERKNRDFIDQLKLSIETREKKIAEKNKKIEEIRRKSFFQKLLRR